MNYIQYMKPGSKFWALPNGQKDLSWSEFWNNWKEAIGKAKDQIIDNFENLKQDYKDAADPIATSERKQSESIEATRAKQASMKFVSDNRTDYEKDRDRKNLELKEFEQNQQQNKEATDAIMWTLTGIPYAVQHLASPDGVIKTYGNTKAAVQNGGGPYIEKAAASAAGDVLDATIFAAPLFTPEARLARAMNKNIRNTTLQPTVADEAVLRGQLGWAPKQTIPYRHGSLDSELKTFVPKRDRWDVVTHGADPNMYFVTHQSTPVSAANMMDLRPYQYTGNIVAEKPMVQVGDFNIAGKNATRNQLIARARQQGADAYLLQDIVDNKVPHQNVVARFIGPEGEAVQGKPATVEWYGPTMGKTTAAKVDPNLVDIDPLLKPIRAKHAEKLGLKISDPKVSADPAYKQEVADFVLEWRANPENQGKTLVASTKHLLAPEYNIQFANEPAIPEFDVFAARNKARGFKETDEQLRAWYNSILEQGRNLVTDNRFVSDIKSGTRAAQISEAERLGIPKGTKYYTKEENIAFRNQINDFAKKYGYEPIGDEVTDPEVLERYARSLIKRHNTFYRGVELNPQESNLSLEYMATHAPGGGAGELYITPYQSVAAMYGEPVEILRPYKLGADRTKWFDEGNFPIYTAGGRRDIHLWENKKGIAAPWLTSETFEGKSDWIYKPRVETELTGRNQQFIPISVQYRNIHPHLYPVYRVGSLAVPTTAFYKSGGKLNYLNLMNDGYRK